MIEKQQELTRRLPPSDPLLQNLKCVYQILKRHYAAYTPEMVERVTGCPKETFLKIAEALLNNAGRERTGAWCYAVGWTHHTTGVQMIRAAAIIQCLLGNIGRPGGGILALRGHCSIQGSTDVPTLYNMLPGYLPQPSAMKPHNNFDRYVEVETPPTGWWHNFPKYIISLLRAWYGDAASPHNEWRYQWIPKICRRSLSGTDDARHRRWLDSWTAADRSKSCDRRAQQQARAQGPGESRMDGGA
jgi:formate dehydrogenase major subunit